MAFRALKVFGTFEKRTPGADPGFFLGKGAPLRNAISFPRSLFFPGRGETLYFYTWSSLSFHVRHNDQKWVILEVLTK